MDQTIRVFRAFSVLLFFMMTVFSNLFAIEPPTILYPLDGDTNVSFDEFYMEFEASVPSGYSLEVATDTVNLFNSSAYLVRTSSKSTFTYYNNFHLLSQWFYIRARLMSHDKQDSTKWSVTKYRTHGPLQIDISDTMKTNSVKFLISKASSEIRYTFDTTKTFDSPIAATLRLKNSGFYAPIANIDSATYYYKCQTMTMHDTSGFSEIDSFYTKFDIGLTVESGCVGNGKAIGHFNFTSPYVGGQFGRNMRMQCYRDSNYLNKFMDTILGVKTSIIFDGCSLIYLKLSALKDSHSSTRLFVLELCSPSAKVIPFGIDSSFQFIFPPCIEKFILEFDSSPYFNSQDKLVYTYNLPDSLTGVPIEIDFKDDPINYYWRFKSTTTESSSKWKEMGRLYRQYVSLEDETDIHLKINGTTLLKRFKHKYQVQIDTLPDFSSSKLHTFYNDSISGSFSLAAYWKLGGHLYSSANYIRFNLISPLGESEANSLRLLIKPVTVDTRNKVFDYPYRLPNYNEEVKYEFSSSKNFEDDIIGNRDVLNTFLPDKTYWLRYKKVNPLDSTGWLDTMPYVTENTKYVLHPVKISPANWSDVTLTQSQTKTFHWSYFQSDFANRYIFAIYKDTVQNSSLFYINLLKPLQDSIVVKNIENDAIYYWSVVSVNDIKTGLLKPAATYWRLSTYGTNNIEGLNRGVHFFPNPTDGLINIKCDRICKIKSIHISNMWGVEWPIQNDLNENVLDLSGYRSGIYFIIVSFMDGSRSVSKLHLDKHN